MTFSIIQKLQLEEALRMDAEYYQPNFLKNEKLIKKFKLITLGDISSISYGTTPANGIFENNGIPFIRSQNFNNLTINGSDLVFCTKKFHTQNIKSNVLPGDILFAAVGATIGELAIVQNDLKESNINQNIVKVRLRNKNLSPYYVGLFFNSEKGQLQIFRLITGNAQPYLNSEQIKSLIVPIISRKEQDTIGDFFKKIEFQIEISKKYYQHAEKLLLKDLCLENFEMENKLFSIVNLSDCQKNNRMDSDFYQQKYFDLLNVLNKTQNTQLANFVGKKKQIIKINKDETYNYIEISDVNVSNGECLSNEILGNELPANAKYKLEGGELIVSKVRPTRGAIAIIPENYNHNFIASGAFSIYNIESPMREYLQVVLRSLVGKLQMERPTTGTSYPTITDQDVENLLIPILPKETQEKIADLVRKSHIARQKSKELLDEAKKKVEELIEKGESHEIQ